MANLLDIFDGIDLTDETLTEEELIMFEIDEELEDLEDEEELLGLSRELEDSEEW